MPFNHNHREERQRLSLIEIEQDPLTTARIASFGIAPDWHCLEAGAGAGSIAYWLADHCPAGQVVATDLDVSLLDGDRHANLWVRRHDVARDDFPPNSFDLIHARAVLTHVPDTHVLLVRMASWLRPGGWLLLEDPASFTLESSPDPLLRKATAASSAMMSAMGFDPGYSRGFPMPLVRAGLVEVDMECRLRMMRGGDVEAELLRLTLSQIADPLAATGLITTDEVARVCERLADPSFVDFPPAFVRAWGRRPD